MPNSNLQPRILHVITGLGLGGAEMMLYKLVRAHQDAFDNHVIALAGVGPLAGRIQALGIPVHSLHMLAGLPDPLAFIRLTRRVQALKPDLVQTWMYHADLAGGLAAWLAGDLPLVWGIHNSTLDLRQSKARTRLVAAVNARLSRWLPDRIVSCSHQAARLHQARGYPAEKMVVIPNGFDLEEFTPDFTARAWLRSSLGLPAESRIIGHAGRFDPQKDYPTLLSAAARLLELEANDPGAPVHFVLCGAGVTGENQELARLAAPHGLAQRVHLLGRRDDIARVMAGFDVGTLSSSYGEAFPNVIGEMMACEIPCVVTDVGDCAAMVGDSGRAVAPGDPQALAHAWYDMLTMPRGERQQAGKAAREHIVRHYAIEEVAGRYADVYRSILRSGQGAA